MGCVGLVCDESQVDLGSTDVLETEGGRGLSTAYSCLKWQLLLGIFSHNKNVKKKLKKQD